MNILVAIILWMLCITPSLAEPPPTTLRTERLQPKAVVMPTPNATAVTSNKLSRLRQWLAHGDRILESDTPVLGYITASIRGHDVISQGDTVLIRYEESLPIDTILDVFRSGPVLNHPVSGEFLGRIAFRQGSVRITQVTPQGILAIVTTSLQAILPGDQLAPPQFINTDFTVHANAANSMSGLVLHIRDGLEEAASPMVIAVSVGRRDRAVQGLTLPVYQAGREQSVEMPLQPIGQAILFQIGDKISFAMLDSTKMAVHRGDRVRLH
ncbi:MAG: hypothetical protein HQL93_13210 [Magnetococcales bacterium]|nr:hypothetical protein [Magnetococcales bacterium]